MTLVACTTQGVPESNTETAASTPAEVAVATETPAPAAAEATATPAQEPAAPAPEVARPEVVAEGSASTLEPLARDSMYTVPPTMTIDTGKFYYATLKLSAVILKCNSSLIAPPLPLTILSS